MSRFTLYSYSFIFFVSFLRVLLFLIILLQNCEYLFMCVPRDHNPPRALHLEPTRHRTHVPTPCSLAPCFSPLLPPLLPFFSVLPFFLKFPIGRPGYSAHHLQLQLHCSSCNMYIDPLPFRTRRRLTTPGCVRSSAAVIAHINSSTLLDTSTPVTGRKHAFSLLAAFSVLAYTAENSY